MVLESTLQERLKIAMDEAGLAETKKARVHLVAAAADISYPAAKKIVYGPTGEMTSSNNAMVAAALNVNPNWLATGSGPMKSPGGVPIPSMSLALSTAAPEARAYVMWLRIALRPLRPRQREQVLKALADMAENIDDDEVVEETAEQLELLLRKSRKAQELVTPAPAPERQSS